MATITHTLALMAALLAIGSAASQEARPAELLLEAEDFKLVKGWRVEDRTYFPSQPNLWSRTKIVADEGDEPAVAAKTITVPEDGRYNVWVRYESCYGFGSVFEVSIKQGRRTISAGTFGRKQNIKHFPFGRGWTAQGPWFWHNADYVYEFATVELAEGKAEVSITKGVNERPAAKRVVDLLYITSDLDLRCADDWNWRGEVEPPILGRFKRPYYFKLDYARGTGAVLPTIRPRLWLIGYYQGPTDAYFIGREGLLSAEPMPEKRLQPGESTGWMRIDFSTAMPTVFSLEKDTAEALLRVSVSYEPQGKGPSRTLDWTGRSLQLLCAVGMPAYERDIFPNGQKIITWEEFVSRKVESLRAYEPPGRRARRFFIQTSSVGEDLAELVAAAGVNSVYYATPPFIYGKDAPDRGFNRSRGFLTVQNAHLTRECFEGDFAALESQYKAVLEAAKKDGVDHIPLEFKLIEEAGPPSLVTLRQWPKMREQFVAFLKEQRVDPRDVLPRDVLANLLDGPDRPSEDQLWGMVQLGEGTHDESLSAPALFYYSHLFRAELMARTCARATELLERVFGPGTLASSGSFYPSSGHAPTLDRGDDPFTLFIRRGVTSFSSEMSWGWGGSPDFIGPQVASYEGALARSLSKYFNCPKGTYIIADPNRGYTGDVIETYSYGLVSNCFYRLNFYFIGYPGECSAVASSDIHKAVKRVSYNVGAVEDRVLDSEVVPAEVALGWNLTTDIWDLATPPGDPLEVLNNVYPQERCLLYLLLRHCQVPVDILGEQDLTAGYLSKYKVYFLVGDHLRPESAEALREWVRAGGTLISVAGGGLLDHRGRPLDTLKEVFGIQSAPIEKRSTCMRPKLELLHAAPLDRITFSAAGAEGIRMEVYAWRQPVVPSEGTDVLGRFMDGSPAVTLSRFGAGRAILIGALPGLPYVRTAIPLLPYGRGGRDNLSTFVPTGFNADVRRAIQAILDLGGARRPIVCSDPLVEPTLLESKDGARYHVALVNYDTEPKEALEVKVTGLGRLRLQEEPGVASRAGEIEGDLVIRTSLDRFRLITLDKL